MKAAPGRTESTSSASPAYIQMPCVKYRVCKQIHASFAAADGRTKTFTSARVVCFYLLPKEHVCLHIRRIARVSATGQNVNVETESLDGTVSSF